MRLNSFLMLGVSVFLLSSSTLLAGTQSSSALRLSEAVETGPNYEVFGDPMPNKAAGLSLADLIDQRESYLEKEVRVSAKITQVCQAKGCFFIAVENDKWARITFRDYAFLSRPMQLTLKLSSRAFSRRCNCQMLKRSITTATSDLAAVQQQWTRHRSTRS